MELQPCVYILANGYNGALYTGVTSDIVGRVTAHKHGYVKGHSKRYEIKQLVYYEFHADMPAAIRREKIIKKWLRKQKVQLINRTNPHWRDLYGDIAG